MCGTQRKQLNQLLLVHAPGVTRTGSQQVRGSERDWLVFKHDAVRGDETKSGEGDKNEVEHTRMVKTDVREIKNKVVTRHASYA